MKRSSWRVNWEEQAQSGVGKRHRREMNGR